MVCFWFRAETGTDLALPFFSGIRAGFPSPAADYLDTSIDLNKTLVTNPPATFYGRVVGDSMKDEGISEGDIIVVDRSVSFKNNCLAVCYLDGQFTLKRVELGKSEALLVSANPKYKPIHVTQENDFIIWGIVTYVIKQEY